MGKFNLRKGAGNKCPYSPLKNKGLISPAQQEGDPHKTAELKKMKDAEAAFMRESNANLNRVEVHDGLVLNKDPETGWVATRTYIDPKTKQTASDTIPYRNLTPKTKKEYQDARDTQQKQDFMATDEYKQHYTQSVGLGYYYDPNSGKMEFQQPEHD